jgi:hypothetical protein
MNNLFAQVVDGEIKRLNIRRGTPFNGISFGKNSPDATYIEHGLWPVVGQAPSLGVNQKISGIQYEVGNQVVNKVFTVETLTDEEILRSQTTFDVLSVDTWEIPADSVTTVTATYTSEDTVYFTVNSVVYPVEPVDFVATLEITADAPGPVEIQVKDQQLVVTALEV